MTTVQVSELKEFDRSRPSNCKTKHWTQFGPSNLHVKYLGCGCGCMQYNKWYVHKKLQSEVIFMSKMRRGMPTTVTYPIINGKVVHPEKLLLLRNNTNQSVDPFETINDKLKKDFITAIMAINRSCVDIDVKRMIKRTLVTIENIRDVKQAYTLIDLINSK